MDTQAGRLGAGRTDALHDHDRDSVGGAPALSERDREILDF